MKINLKSSFFWVRYGALAMFVGRAWQHFWWDAPYRSLFWDERMMSPVVRYFGLTWQQFTHDLRFDAAFTVLTRGYGVLDAVCALLLLLGWWRHRLARFVLWVGVAHCCLLATVYCKESFYHVGQWFEFSLQIALPVAVLCWQWRYIGVFLKLACCLTFICHGLYAVGYYPVPGDYVDMLLNVFGGSEASARQLLLAFGVLDIIAAMLVWLRGWPQKVGLAYFIIWGFLTTIARVYAHYYPETGLASAFDNWWFHSMYRFPHWMGPLAVWFWASAKRDDLEASA